MSKPNQTATKNVEDFLTLEQIYNRGSGQPSAKKPPSSYLIFRTWKLGAREEMPSGLKGKKRHPKISKQWSSASPAVKAHFAQLFNTLGEKRKKKYASYCKDNPQINNEDKTDDAVEKRSNLKRKSERSSDSPGTRLDKKLRVSGDGLNAPLMGPATPKGELGGSSFSSNSQPHEAIALLNNVPSTPGSESRSISQEPVQLTNSAEISGDDYALASNISDIETMDMDLISTELIVTHADPAFDPDQTAGDALGTCDNWEEMSRREDEAYHNYYLNSLNNSSMDQFQADTSTYSSENERAADELLDEFINFDD